LKMWMTSSLILNRLCEQLPNSLVPEIMER
jgi:hypothetical protein